MAKSAPVNPFAAAQRQAKVANKKPQANVFIASSPDVEQAIVNYCNGDEMEKQGKSMKGTSRPIVLDFAMPKFAEQWLMLGKRPANPKVASSDGSDGAFLGIQFKDQSVKLNPDTFTLLANCIGAAKAEEVTIQRDDFTINPDILEERVKVKVDGKVQEMRVMDAIAKALQGAFAPSPEILANLFKVNEKFETTKGLIDMAPSLVAPDKTPNSVQRLVQFLKDFCYTPTLKPGANGTD